MDESRYITRAIDLFKWEGMSMPIEEIAQKIGVSKKTLYNHFVSKDELLEKCVEQVKVDLMEQLDCMRSPTKDVCECFVLGVNAMRAFFKEMSPVFLQDLQRFYPHMANNDHIFGSSFFIKLLSENIERGQAESIYRKEIDATLMAGYISFSIFAYFHRAVMMNSNYSADYYFDQVITFNLKALKNN